MQQVKCFETSETRTLENQINEFLKDIQNKGYDLMEIYYSSSPTGQTSNSISYNALVLYDDSPMVEGDE